LSQQHITDETMGLAACTGRPDGVARPTEDMPGTSRC
jgi:hypothetical protein